jgi:hypothetical protein
MEIHLRTPGAGLAGLPCRQRDNPTQRVVMQHLNHNIAHILCGPSSQRSTSLETRDKPPELIAWLRRRPNTRGPMAHARIGRIRMKAGGAEVRLIRQETPNRDGSENWKGKLVEASRSIAGFKGEIVGYAVIAVYDDGSYSSGFRIDDDRCPVPATLWPAYVEEIIRRDMVTPRAVHDTLEG